MHTLEIAPMTHVLCTLHELVKKQLVNQLNYNINEEIEVCEACNWRETSVGTASNRVRRDINATRVGALEHNYVERWVINP